MPTKIAVIYYSSTGNVHQLAAAVAEGAASTGAEVRLRRVPETAPAGAIASNPLWQAHVDATAGEVQEATPADMEWADGYALGSPTRFGTPAAQMKQFIDTLGGLWFTGKLANKGATAFTSAQNVHGGNESTLLTFFNIFSHFGAVIVPPGYTDPLLFAAGGNPYGSSTASGGQSATASAEELEAARYQGRRLAEMTTKIVA
ncbi:NAD(P)H:quinone oxidoreductase [Modestobacter sp. VKM Ac-2986]|uniref:NAD(P)H:quinone oxidoreductase n=1 Tax=Modestobacter sp. VKM Ac-2986 TaxID=3004140 RepID=UPI0022AA526B|nr:NAD(P)H:quinone oxidoreductase [Modestobacter sp. VKM Ac-2986]MCZ2828889.1 NAD(P)H:quinone oxidoreductase [Modestobacter sp. VKM Ac-2986]